MTDDTSLPLEPIPLEDPPDKPLTTLRVVIISAFVALVIGCLPALTTALVIGDNIQRTQGQIIQGRVATTRIICNKINAGLESGNSQSRFLQNLIIQSVKQSRPFEKSYRQFGLPKYDERLKQSRSAANGLKAREAHKLNCNALIREVSGQK